MIKRVLQFFAVLFVLSFFQTAFANEVAVFDIRRPIAMSNKDKTYKDFYINAGMERGLKPGVMVTVTRRRSLYDAYQNKSPGDLQVPVGKLKIIHAQKGLSVGRLYSVFSREKIPSLEYNTVMVGDRVDLNTIKAIRKTASVKVKKKTRVVPLTTDSIDPMYGPFQAMPELPNVDVVGPQ